MNPARCALVLFILVAAFSAAVPASAKTALPDLVVTKISKPPKTKTIGSKIKLVVKVANKGGSQASASKLGLYLGKGKKHTKKVRAGEYVQKFKKIKKGGRVVVTWKSKATRKLKAGTYLVQVDAGAKRGSYFPGGAQVKIKIVDTRRR